MLEEIVNGEYDLSSLSLNELKEDLLLEIRYEFYSEKLDSLKLLIGYEKLSITKELKSNAKNDLLCMRRKQTMINVLNFVTDKIDSRLRRLKYIQYDYVEES